ncbi:hypothetical protein [Streptomyces sp. NPDC005017]|uniref:hypothetical protein n=1 Tax=Streptomyces sp. NPDC005017 TaxID=3364706 RepID=UPI0036AE9AD9
MHLVDAPDGGAGEGAGEWLRKDRPEISIRWTEAAEHDPDTYGRILKLLFSPRADSGTA